MAVRAFSVRDDPVVQELVLRTKRAENAVRRRKNQIARGEAVPIKDIKQRRMRQMQEYRAFVEALPARLAQKCVSEGNPLTSQQYQDLVDVLHAYLSSLADMPDGWLQDPGSDIVPRLVAPLRKENRRVTPNGHHDECDYEGLNLLALRCMEQECLESLAPEEPMKASEWTDRHYVLVTESASVPHWDVWRYQRDMIDILCMPSTRPHTMYWMKSARIGWTEAVKASAAYLVAHASRHVVIYQADNDSARRFAMDNIDPLVDKMPVLKDMTAIEQGRAGKGSNYTGARSAVHKQLNGRTLRVLGAKTRTNFRQFSADTEFLDETDLYPVSVGGEDGDGDPVLLARRGVSSSPFGRVAAGSTPTNAGNSLIEKGVASADLQFVFRVPCPNCGEFGHLDFYGDRSSWGMEWSRPEKKRDGYSNHDVSQMAASIRYRPQCCGKPWTHDRLAEAVDKGHWGTEDGALWIDNSDPDRWPSLRTAEGEEEPWPGVIGFRMSRVYNINLHWSTMLEYYYSNRSDPNSLRTWWNNYIGVPYRESENQVSDNLARARETDRDWVPPDMQLVIAASDVQIDRVSTLVVGFASGFRTYLLDRIEHFGPTEEINDQAWAQWRKWLVSDPKWKTGHPEVKGGELPIDHIAVDARDQRVTDTVYQLCRQGHVFQTRAVRLPVMGVYSPTTPFISSPRRKTMASGLSVQCLHINVNAGKDIVVPRLNAGMDERDSARTVFYSPRIQDEVFAELQSEYRKRTRTASGRPSFIWRKLSPRHRNEALDAAVYASAVAALLSGRRTYEFLRGRPGKQEKAEK